MDSIEPLKIYLPNDKYFELNRYTYDGKRYSKEENRLYDLIPYLNNFQKSEKKVLCILGNIVYIRYLLSVYTQNISKWRGSTPSPTIWIKNLVDVPEINDDSQKILFILDNYQSKWDKFIKRTISQSNCKIIVVNKISAVDSLIKEVIYIRPSHETIRWFLQRSIEYYRRRPPSNDELYDIIRHLKSDRFTMKLLKNSNVLPIVAYHWSYFYSTTIRSKSEIFEKIITYWFGLTGAESKDEFSNFSMNLAWKMFKENKSSLLVKDTYHELIDKNLIGCPWRREDNFYFFVDDSFHAYFLALKIYQDLIFERSQWDYFKSFKDKEINQNYLISYLIVFLSDMISKSEHKENILKCLFNRIKKKRKGVIFVAAVLRENGLEDHILDSISKIELFRSDYYHNLNPLIFNHSLENTDKNKDINESLDYTTINLNI